MEDNGPTQQHSQGMHEQNDSVMSVGSSTKDDGNARIRDLEEEVKQLAEKANTASQRYADYENEIRVLEAKLRQEQRKHAAPTDGSSNPSQLGQPAGRPGISRFGSFMSTRKPSNPLLDKSEAAHAGSREKELEEQLVKEQTARIAAETKVKDLQAELEELSATLFEEANTMVATERRQNAELKQKLVSLEERQQAQLQQHLQQQLEQQLQQQRSPLTSPAPMSESGDVEKLRTENEKLRLKVQSLEQREGDRKKRLERLEAASKRIERTKAMLQPP